jgi:hypothetical protein
MKEIMKERKEGRITKLLLLLMVNFFCYIFTYLFIYLLNLPCFFIYFILFLFFTCSEFSSCWVVGKMPVGMFLHREQRNFIVVCLCDVETNV